MQKARAAMKPSPTAWDGAGLGVILLATAIAVFFFASYILVDFAWQKLPAYVVVTGALCLAGALAVSVLALLQHTGPLYRTALLVFAPFVLVVFPVGDDATGMLFGAAMLLLASTIGGSIAVLRAARWRFARQRAATTVLALGLAGVATGLYATFSDIDDPNPWLADYVQIDRTLPLPNPGLPGDYAVATLTYGSGSDRRDDFGADVDLVSRSVDGSKLIDNWDGLSGWLRTTYWGFDSSALPLQGRVWYPQDEGSGDGPYPLVLIVHGNHSMEDYSDPGYAWLGELLASRGIILVSVDENFLNSSVSASVDLFDERPGLEEENDARGWLLLQHLALWRDWNDEPGHAFAGRVDMERVALIGHSRGGEAVGIAAAFNGLARYPDDATLAFDFGFALRGVIAIAPVDGQYEPREKPTPIRNVSYFTIHGSMDGDVQSFDGTAQYTRVGFDGAGDFGFRASLFVEGANHGQFNTTWGRYDTGPFRAWALDLERIMPAEDQREVARVFFSAFLEIVLRGRVEYLPIFADVRHAAAWLPDRYYISQYSDSTYRVLADFEEDIDPETLTLPGGRLTTHALSKWYETANSIKYDELDTHAAVFAWDSRHSDETAWADFALPEDAIRARRDSVLVISLADAGVPTLPDGADAAGENGEDGEDDGAQQPLDWTVILRDGAGEEASLPLGSDALLYPQVRSIPRHAGFLESDDPAEVLFRRFSFPLTEFRRQNPRLDPARLAGLRFVFDRSEAGAVIVDDIALEHPRALP